MLCQNCFQKLSANENCMGKEFNQESDHNYVPLLVVHNEDGISRK